VRTVTWRLVTFALRRYLVGGLLWLPVHVIPLASGLLLKLLFDRISGGRPVDLHGASWLCAAFVGTELVRGAVMVVAWVYGVYWWDAAATVLRGNALRAILAAAGRLPGSSGEALARLRDDVATVVSFVDEFIPLTGSVLFAVGAFVVMARIDRVVTLIVLLPMLAVGVLSTWARATVKRLHARAQASGAAVTGYLGEVFANVLAIRTSGAEAAVLARLAGHNRARRHAAVRDRLATDLLDAGTGASVELGIGLVLLLVAGAMRRGGFTVGDLALFTTYVSWLTGLPRSIGGLLFRVPQVGVAVQRLRRLLAPGRTPGELVRDTEVWFGRTPPPEPVPVPAHDDPLDVLEARELAVRLPGGGGIEGVDVRITRGSFTVVTGAVGSGKTTLIRALLGLVRPDAGTVRWNGRAVGALVPPRVAYASQVPRLFSATLRENLLLGWPDGQLSPALYLAALDGDVARMPDGLDTVVGSRGVRLSGGQVQRATAARALVRAPDLLVLDDLSSALDVDTEALLWNRLADAGPGTLLVVSHRRAALARADQVIVLDRGRVVGAGRLADLLRDCVEMQRLWTDEVASGVVA
jgi:ATP-binding cassette, subfamily B, bacterial